MTTTKTIRPGTHNAILLGILADGKAHTTSGIIRRHPMMVHSRVSELRRRGFGILHEKVPGKEGPRAHTYQLVSIPPDVSIPDEVTQKLARLLSDDEGPEFILEWEEIWPRTPEYRYRLYRLNDDGAHEVLSAQPTPECVGTALVEMGREGQLDRIQLGLFDTFGTDEKPGVWIWNPWDQR